MKGIALKGALAPKGHYMPAVESCGLVFSSGLLPMDPITGAPVRGSFEVQMEALFRNAATLLASAGCAREDVVKITAYLSDVALWGRFNAACAAFFGSHKPARTVVPLGGKLHYGLDVEMAFVAECREGPHAQ